MKIRKLADAAIVAALLMASVPDLNVGMTPDDLLMHAAQAAVQQSAADDTHDDPAPRRLS